MIKSRLLFMLCVLVAAGAAGAGDGTAERPRLKDYDNPDHFISDVLAWERRQRRSASNGERAEKSQDQGNDSDDWHNVTGPEKLDEALRKARGYTPPDYEAKYRFNRTTHLSFPLPRLEGEQMAGQAITGGLRDETAQEPSLEPLPELRTILEETGDAEEMTAAELLDTAPRLSAPRRQTVQVDMR